MGSDRDNVSYGMMTGVAAFIGGAFTAMGCYDNCCESKALGLSLLVVATATALMNVPTACGEIKWLYRGFSVGYKARKRGKNTGRKYLAGVESLV